MNALALRCVVLVVMLLAARQVIAGRDIVDMPLPAPLEAFPRDVAGWRGADQPPLDPEVARVLAADDYLNRVYYADTMAPIGLYIAYYASQRQGDAIHSPQHCLPGAGWQPVSRGTSDVDTPQGRLTATRYVVEKNGRRQLVLYWFEGRGRAVANEYANKLYLVADAVRLRRTEGALVRVMTPIDGDESAADATAARFVRALKPQLTHRLPS